MFSSLTIPLALAILALPPAGARGVSAPADSLALRLQQAERTAARPRDAGEAALLLGRLFYARGEYRPATDAFARAAARLDPARKSEALYWGGLSWLGLHQPNPARAALEEVAAGGSSRRAEAQLGIAMAWEQAGRPDRAYETLQLLLASNPGEAAPGALEHLAVLADRFHRPDEAVRARARLLASYPSSMEAAMASAALVEPAAPAPASGPIALEVGRFAGPTRARALAARAVRAGFTNARVITHGDGAASSYAVLLGSFQGKAAARAAQARVARELGLSARLTGVR